MFEFDATQPLWLPSGSIRALLAIAATAGYMAGWVDKELILLAWGFYFGSRPIAKPNGG